MKKILFIINSLHIAGLQRALIPLANRLADLGWAVTILILIPKDDLKGELRDSIRVIYKSPHHHLGSKLPYIRHILYDDGMWERRAGAQSLYKYYVGKECYDAEVAFSSGIPAKIISGSTNKNAVHLAWIHEDYQKSWRSSNPFNARENVFDAFAFFDKVVCVSKYAENSFIKTIGDTGNVTTIYNIIPADEIIRKAAEPPEIKIDRASFHIVLCGRLINDIKGQGRLIDAVVRLRSEGADISLALIGSGRDKEMLADMIRKNNAASYIFLPGEFKNPYPFIKESDLLVCASYQEGFNLTVLEALILGVPVMSAECTGPNEILDHGKYGMLTENSAEGLYRGLKSLYEQPDLLRRYKNAADERARFFDSDDSFRQILRLIERK